LPRVEKLAVIQICCRVCCWWCAMLQ